MRDRQLVKNALQSQNLHLVNFHTVAVAENDLEIAENQVSNALEAVFGMPFRIVIRSGSQLSDIIYLNQRSTYEYTDEIGLFSIKTLLQDTSV